MILDFSWNLPSSQLHLFCVLLEVFAKLSTALDYSFRVLGGVGSLVSAYWFRVRAAERPFTSALESPPFSLVKTPYKCLHIYMPWDPFILDIFWKKFIKSHFLSDMHKKARRILDVPKPGGLCLCTIYLFAVAVFVVYDLESPL